MPENPAPITTASKSGVALGIRSSFVLLARIMHHIVHISYVKYGLSTSGRGLALPGSEQQ
jgi:hypothetical protein